MSAFRGKADIHRSEISILLGDIADDPPCLTKSAKLKQMLLVPVVFLFIGSIVHVVFMRQPRNVANILGIFLQYAFIFVVATSGFIGFLGHTFRADEVAKQIGWPQGNPFQFEVAVANLAFGVLGLLTIWFRGNFWLATAAGYAVFMIGAGIGHVRQLVATGNRAEMNAGAVILAADLAFPLILLILVVIHRRLKGPPAW